MGLLADIDGAKFLRLLVYHVYIAEVLAILGTLGTVPVEDVVMIPAWFAHQEINMTHQSAFAKPYHGAVDKVSQQPSRYVIMRKTT